MNKLTGIIRNVKSNAHMSIVEMEVKDTRLKTIVIETPATAPFLREGNAINVLFKETEVSIAKNYSGGISLQNKLECRISDIQKGKLLSKIALDFQDNDISSIITSSAVEQLTLNVNDHVTALIKTNEIIIAPDD